MTKTRIGKQLLIGAAIATYWLVIASGWATPEFGIANEMAASPDEKLVLEPWSENVFLQAEKEYGRESAERLRVLYKLIQAHQHDSLREKLELINDTVNQLPWISDQELWNADDYWATPLEALTRFGGDCEDMAIGKFVLLRALGIPKHNLFLGYAKVRETDETHMVLVWLNDDRTESLVLDNLDKVLKSGKERQDLLAVYLFDADENLILLNDDNGNRSLKAELGFRKMSKLEEVKRRIFENNEKYKAFNDGKPLWATYY